MSTQELTALSDSIPPCPSREQLLSALKAAKLWERCEIKLEHAQFEIDSLYKKLQLKDTKLTNKDIEISNLFEIIETYKSDSAINKIVQANLVKDIKTLNKKLKKQDFFKRITLGVIAALTILVIIK